MNLDPQTSLPSSDQGLNTPAAARDAGARPDTARRAKPKRSRGVSFLPEEGKHVAYCPEHQMLTECQRVCEPADGIDGYECVGCQTIVQNDFVAPFEAESI